MVKRQQKSRIFCDFLFTFYFNQVWPEIRREPRALTWIKRESQTGPDSGDMSPRSLRFQKKPMKLVTACQIPGDLSGWVGWSVGRPQPGRTFFYGRCWRTAGKSYFEGNGLNKRVFSAEPSPPLGPGLGACRVDPPKIQIVVNPV